jgi:Fe2+ or Zn2+ uptake regulation protein
MPLQPNDAIDAELTTALRERGQRVTSQRLVIHRLVRTRDRHLSAEEVYEGVAPTLPGTSLPTVYATLELLEDLGIVRRVHAGRHAVLFDPRADHHQHLLCRSCGAVEDLTDTPELERGLLAACRAASRQGFEADRAELVVRGLCGRCAAQSDRPSPGANA